MVYDCVRFVTADEPHSRKRSMETRFMRATFATLAAVALLVSAPVAQTKTAKPAKTLDIYALDVEGGKATLVITPAGESVLIDSANPVPRDTDRIMAVLA